MVYPFVQFWHILSIKVAIFMSALIIALAINPDWHVTLPWSLQTIYVSIITGVIVVSTGVEIKFAMMEKGVSGLTGFSYLGFIILFTGIAFIVYMLYFQYQLTDPNINRWFAWYLVVGAIILFAQSREELLHFKRLRQRITG